MLRTFNKVCIFLVFAAACSSSDDTSTAASSGAAVGTAQIGEPCPNGATDCASGLQCDGGDPNGGQCYLPCTPEMDDECGDTSKFVCNFEGHCYPKCASNTDCKRASEGYVCRDDVPARAVKYCDPLD